MTLGERIKMLRKEQKLSQMELALKAGYTTRSTISAIEKGVRNPTVSSTAKIASALGTTPTYLMGWEEDEIDYLSNMQKDADKYDDEYEVFVEKLRNFNLNQNHLEALLNYAEFLSKKE